MHGCMHVWPYGSMYVCMDVWMYGYMDDVCMKHEKDVCGSDSVRKAFRVAIAGQCTQA